MTIATCLLLCTTGSAGLKRLQFGAIDRRGEIASGALIAWSASGSGCGR